MAYHNLLNNLRRTTTDVCKLSIITFIHLLLLNIRNGQGVLAVPEVTAVIPVNPIPEGGLLAFHCKISGLERSHDVAMTGPRGLRISYGDNILLDDDNRFFLAVRQIADGSTVYFLSITDITKSDAGRYACKVLNMTGTASQVAAQTVTAQVSFLPSDNPTCAHSANTLNVFAGSMVTYNCSSEQGYPGVSLHWSRIGGTGRVPEGSEYTDGGLVTSVLKWTPSVEDSGFMLTCTVRSKYFAETKTCHVGPITVVKDPYDKTITDHKDTTVLITGATQTPDISVTRRKPSKIICKRYCVEQESSLFIWIISTVSAASLAFILFIIGLLLFIKLRYRTVEATALPPQHCINEEIYAELEKRFEHEDAVYMDLERSEKVYNAYNQTLPRRTIQEVQGYVVEGNTSL